MTQQSPSFNDQLFNYRNSLYFFALSFTKNEDDAKDLVQDTMVKALRYSVLFKEGTNFKAWLYTILKNTFINDFRRNQRATAIFTVTDEITHTQLSKSAYLNDGDSKFMMDDIQFALNKLQSEYRIPFIKYFEGFKYHEIAEELNIPIGTVKTRIHCARLVLKKQLKMYKDNLRKAS